MMTLANSEGSSVVSDHQPPPQPARTHHLRHALNTGGFCMRAHKSASPPRVEVAGGCGRSTKIAGARSSREVAGGRPRLREIAGDCGRSREVAGGRGSSSELAGGRSRLREITRDSRRLQEIAGDRAKSPEIAGDCGRLREVAGRGRVCAALSCAGLFCAGLGWAVLGWVNRRRWWWPGWPTLCVMRIEKEEVRVRGVVVAAPEGTTSTPLRGPMATAGAA